MHRLLTANLAYVLLGAMLVLLVAGVVRFVDARRSKDPAARQRLGSVVVWWMIVGLLLLASIREPFPGVSIPPGLVGLLITAAVSLLGLREFFRLTEASRRYGGIQWVGYAVIPVYYYCVAEATSILPFALTLLAVPLFSAGWLILRGRTKGYLSAVASLLWGVTVAVVCLSHAALLWRIPESANPSAGGAGWFVYLVLLVQANDIAQALWGRALGRRKIAPIVSPGKTWEGFLLGVATTLVLSVLLAIPLTPLTEDSVALDIAGASIEIPYLRAVAAGLIVALGGFVGDLNMSALKRDLGVKDSGNLLPGQGGVLDRIDSLTFAAPLFFYYVFALHGSESP